MGAGIKTRNASIRGKHTNNSTIPSAICFIYLFFFCNRQAYAPHRHRDYKRRTINEKKRGKHAERF